MPVLVLVLFFLEERLNFASYCLDIFRIEWFKRRIEVSGSWPREVQRLAIFLESSTLGTAIQVDVEVRSFGCEDAPVAIVLVIDPTDIDASLVERSCHGFTDNHCESLEFYGQGRRELCPITYANFWYDDNMATLCPSYMWWVFDGFDSEVFCFEYEHRLGGLTILSNWSYFRIP